MKTATITKTYRQHTKLTHCYHIQRDMLAWEALRGIWIGKNIRNVAQWQKKIRKEWDRKLPSLKLADAVIAATTLGTQSILVTRNTGDFKKVPHLSLQKI